MGMYIRLIHVFKRSCNFTMIHCNTTWKSSIRLDSFVKVEYFAKNMVLLRIFVIPLVFEIHMLSISISIFLLRIHDKECNDYV